MTSAKSLSPRARQWCIAVPGLDARGRSLPSTTASRCSKKQRGRFSMSVLGLTGRQAHSRTHTHTPTLTLTLTLTPTLTLTLTLIHSLTPTPCTSRKQICVSALLRLMPAGWTPSLSLLVCARRAVAWCSIPSRCIQCNPLPHMRS